MADLFEVALPDGRRCLLKRPRLEFGSHPACLAGFETEQMVYARLAGPHVPKCYGSGEDDAGPYLLIEHVTGPSLEALAADAPLPAQEVARLGILLANALHDLHRQNVVHHDLVPGHVLLRPDGDMALIDFGLAHHGALPDLAAAESSIPMGSPATIAPEQLLGIRGDPRSDLYAAGAILYRLATGRYPFGKPSGTWDMHRRRWFDAPPPHSLNATLPAWLEEIILHCLAVRPERRYASAALLANDLSHPEQVRQERRSPDGIIGRLALAWQRWRSEARLEPTATNRPVSQLKRAPHVMVAVDTDSRNEALAEAMRLTLKRLIAHDPHWQVTCLSVLEPSILTEQDEADELQRSLHSARLSAIHQWAQPLGLPAGRIRFHVLTGADAATCLIDYATQMHADHLIVGARGSSSMRRLLGSVSSRIATEANCSVTVVRA